MKDVINGWLSPDGKLHQCGYMQHFNWAEEYLTEGLPVLQKLDMLSSGEPVKKLHQMGWVRLLTWTAGETGVFGDAASNQYLLDTIDPSLTEEQKNTLLKWCKANNYVYRDLFNK